MPVVTVNGAAVTVPENAPLSQALGAGMEMPCGGQGRCGKCRVTVRGAVSEPGAAERAHLTADELAAGVRLACQARVRGDCAVTLREAGGDQIRLCGAMPPFAPRPAYRRWGAALDIGTTTLAACLYGPGGERLAQASAPNPQSRWGADVISRIGAALQGEGPALAAAVRAALDGLVREMAAQAGLPADGVDRYVVTGNTAMLYLLTGADPGCLSHAPFEADRLFGETMAAAALGLPGAGQVYLPRCMAAFVGADITCAALAAELCARPGTRMLADIGTNGEIALWHDGRLLCCSTAAGPAFEGAGLSMGMPGRAGAVDHVTVESGALRAHVIGGAAPRGICGSGVVDALACLLETGDLDETGYLEEDPAPIAPPVCLSQKDVRMVQLAKSAVCAGMRTLLKTAGLDTGAVEELAVAGGFGSYLSVASAGRIGLLPPELTDRVRVLGNAALAGASMLLLDPAFVPAAETMAKAARAVELSTDPGFMQAYTEGMFF